MEASGAPLHLQRKDLGVKRDVVHLFSGSTSRVVVRRLQPSAESYLTAESPGRRREIQYDLMLRVATHVCSIDTFVSYLRAVHLSVTQMTS